MRTLDFFQIYYREEQKEHLYPFAIPHFNDTVTDYFENSIIADLVPKSNADLISVCSWRLKAKRGDNIRIKKNHLELNDILQSEFDIAVLTPRSPTHRALAMAAHWHGPSFNEALNCLRDFIRVPVELTTPIYENHFIATREIYHRYVNECLIPAMEYVGNHEIFTVSADYAKRKSPEEVKMYREKTGRVDWPLTPFILERLFSIWIEKKGFKIVNL